MTSDVGRIRCKRGPENSSGHLRKSWIKKNKHKSRHWNTCSDFPLFFVPSAATGARSFMAPLLSWTSLQYRKSRQMGDRKRLTRNKDPRRNYMAYVPTKWRSGRPTSTSPGPLPALQQEDKWPEICWPLYIIIHKRGRVIVGTTQQQLFRKASE